MTPASRQTLMFSATMPAQIVALARANLNHPVHVRAEGQDAQATVPDTTQFVYQAHDLDKPEIIGKLLQAPNVGKVMVFTRTKRAAQRLADELADRGFDAATIHGDLNQAQRERTLKKFRHGKIKALVATDVAARGIDVEGVTHVINYEVPDDSSVHRIGAPGGPLRVAITGLTGRPHPLEVINKARRFHPSLPRPTHQFHLLYRTGSPKTPGRIASTPAKDDEEQPTARPHRSQARRVGKDDKKSDRQRRKRVRRRNGEVIERGDRQPPEALPESTA